MPTAALTAAEFGYVQKLVRDHAAIVLNDDQGYLVETRLAPLAEREGFGSVGRLVSGLRDGTAARLTGRVVDAMTTNETLFFRDGQPFDALRRVVLPDLLRKRQAARRLAVWSAACSTGQEPYSLAMLLREMYPAFAGWEVTIRATDLSAGALEKARRGWYTPLEVGRGLPPEYLPRHFDRDGAGWRVKAEVRAAVRFEPLNLTAADCSFPRADLVLLRNVLIYFDVATKRRVLGRVRAGLPADGYLLLGGAESTLQLDDGFEPAECGAARFFRPRG